MNFFYDYFSAFKCDKCPKAFSAKSSLQAHLNTHRREPPQSCVECNRVFIRQDCLMRHIRAKHRELLEDVMNEVETKHLQAQLYNIAAIAAAKTKTGESRTLSTDELLKAIMDLLKVLIDEETLQVCTGERLFSSIYCFQRISCSFIIDFIVTSTVVRLAGRADTGCSWSRDQKMRMWPGNIGILCFVHR